MKGPDHLLSDRSAVEAEPLQILHHGYPGRRHAITDRGCIPVGRFRAEQDGQYLHNGSLALEAGGDGLVERRSHTLEAKATHRIDHIMPLHNSLAAYHSSPHRTPEDGPHSGPPWCICQSRTSLETGQL